MRTPPPLRQATRAPWRRVAAILCLCAGVLRVDPATAQARLDDAQSAVVSPSPAVRLAPIEGSGAPPPNVEPDLAPPAQTDGRQRALALAIASLGPASGVFDRGFAPDFWVEGGVARHDRRPVGAVRALAGLTAVLDPTYVTLGVVGDYTGTDGFAVGGAVDVLSTGLGVFATLAVLADPRDSAVVSGTLGWQVLALDVQHRPGPQHPGTMVFFKLRAPIGWIVRAATRD